MPTLGSVFKKKKKDKEASRLKTTGNPDTIAEDSPITPSTERSLSQSLAFAPSTATTANSQVGGTLSKTTTATSQNPTSPVATAEAKDQQMTTPATAESQSTTSNVSCVGMVGYLSGV